MSIHLVSCAAQVTLKPSEKLVLLCLAENANGKDSVAFPGMKVLQMWTGLSPARIYAVLARLAEYRLIVQVGAGHRGRAAEFVVFPDGCCEAHGRVIEDEKPPADVRLSESPEPCGNSRGQEAIGEKASSFDRESLQFRPVKPLAGLTPTKYPPTEPPGVERSVTETAPVAANNVHDLSSYRSQRVTAETGFAGHEGHEIVIVRDGDDIAMICECQTRLLVDRNVECLVVP